MIPGIAHRSRAQSPTDGAAKSQTQSIIIHATNRNRRPNEQTIHWGERATTRRHHRRRQTALAVEQEKVTDDARHHGEERHDEDHDNHNHPRIHDMAWRVTARWRVRQLCARLTGSRPTEPPPAARRHHLVLSTRSRACAVGSTPGGTSGSLERKLLKYYRRFDSDSTRHFLCSVLTLSTIKRSF